MKDNISVILFLLPYIVIACIAIYAGVKYLKKHKFSMSAIYSISRELISIPVVNETIEKGLQELADTYIATSNWQLKGAYKDIVNYLSTFLITVIQRTDKVLLDPGVSDIYEVLKANKATVDNVQFVSEYILKQMGYDDVKVKSIIQKAINKYNDEKGEEDLSSTVSEYIEKDE